jgi:uncharacterized protein YdaU (DUF1376 family)
MNADLTRFDFNALRFLKSEHVEMLTAEEVGQLVLLKCNAWLGGKNASLPNNPTLLAKYARCERVSEAVLREWKEGPDGRLYNKTLSEEWDAAMQRSAHGARAASARWRRQQFSGNAQAMLEHSSSVPLVVVGAVANPSQSKPNQSKPSRASHDGVCTELVDFWNANRGALPEVLKITKSRKDKVTARIKADPQFPEQFKRAVLKARETPFCTGAGERHWKASFDWMVENDRNHIRVLEGAYDGSVTKQSEAPHTAEHMVTARDIQPRRLQ